ncbi:MAG: MlaD family protein [Gemmatimonadales bacterium]
MRVDRKQREWSDVRRGAWLIIALLTTGTAIFFMDEARLAVEGDATLMLFAQEAGELRPGAAVWIAGKQAGRVAEIRFLERGAPGSPNLLVRTVLTREAARVLRRDAHATIEPSGLLAPFVVSLEPGGAGQPAYSYDDTLQASLSLTMRDLAAFGDSLRRVVAELEPLATRLKKDAAVSSGTLAALSRSIGAFAELRANLAGLEELAAEPGSLGLLVADTSLAAGLRRSSERLQAVALEASTREGPERFGAAVRALAANLASLDRHLSSARGTAGRMIHDREIQNQIRLFRARADSARTDLVRRPFRWLRVRLF